ncbi:GNAT family N-acetyltransferase [Natrialba aegyptia]|uniref:BioF2-like acetyltransferase domain-containing protein n=1 Tax=Natrialba aegyptia DSM 13077 TaxID=1227491 RepID=M0B9C1_9EURY|nr:GNAT family N-acetyltransferase [Natrialba aegyptia]ELZ07486.1 hypothetical protein C480_05501 [Natrialba aegyptia DSM 13077]
MGTLSAVKTKLDSRTRLGIGERTRETNTDYEVTVHETIDTVDRSRWNHVVSHAKQASVFHRYEWLEAIETGLGYTPNHVVVTKDGNPIGLLPNFVVDLPKVPFQRLWSTYPGFGGPAITTDTAETLDAILETIPTLCTGRTIVHEIRAHDTEYLQYSDVLRSHGYRPARSKGRFVLSLTDGYDQVRSGMSDSRRKGIERGKAHPYEIVEEELTRATLERFHRAYERHMEQIGGDAYPLAFFEDLLAMDSRLLLLTLRLDGEYAGGFLELLDDERSAVHGFFAAVPEEYYDDHASELLYDAVIRWAIDNGYDTYDFGGATGDFRSGLFRFKAGFGGELVPNLYWERGDGLRWKFVTAGRELYLRMRR